MFATAVWEAPSGERLLGSDVNEASLALCRGQREWGRGQNVWGRGRDAVL